MRLVLVGSLVLAVALIIALKRDRAADVPSTSAGSQATAAATPTTAIPQGAVASTPPATDGRPDKQSSVATASGKAPRSNRETPAPAAMPAVRTPPASSPKVAALPRLVDVGADKCIPCKAMVPILEELRREYAGRLRVDFIDAWKYPDQAEPFNVYGIPTQIFFDPAGRELHRHLGFISKEEILETWRKLGYRLTPGEES